MNETYDYLENNNKPRVHIKYEIETEQGVIEKSLPFVVGVMGDFSGDAVKKPLSDRKFIQIDKDNFDKVIDKMTPSVSFNVENMIDCDGSTFSVSLNFKSMDDFLPENIVQQVPSLKKLIDTRNKLRDLITQIDLVDSLEPELERIILDNAHLLNNNSDGISNDENNK